MVEVNLKLILTYLWVNISIRLRIRCTLICFVLFCFQSKNGAEFQFIPFDVSSQIMKFSIVVLSVRSFL